MTLLNLPKSNYKYVKAYHTTKRGHISKSLARLKAKAIRKNLPFDLTLDYLESIATDECPIFGTPFVWGLYIEKKTTAVPSLDRVVPELGYIVGNVVYISHKANAIKQDVTEKEIYAVADWLHYKRKEVLDAFKKPITSLPIEHVVISKPHSSHRFVLGTGAWEDRYGADYNPRESAWEDLDRCTQAGGRDGVVTGMWEMGTFTLTYNSKSYGLTDGAGIGVEELQRLIYCKLRELGLVVGKESQVRLSNNRREQPIQRSLDETFQGIKEASKEL
jgi:hypothetical protein